MSMRLLQPPRVRSSRAPGYALPIVLLVLILLSVAFMAMLDTARTAAQSTGRALHARQHFYTCEGLMRLAAGISARGFIDDPGLTAAGLTALLAPVVSLAATQDVTISNMPPTAVEDDAKEFIETGPLTGLQVSKTAVAVSATSTPDIGCTFTFSQITAGMFATQFAILSDTGALLSAPVSGSNDYPHIAWSRSGITGSASVSNVTVMDEGLLFPAPPANDPMAALDVNARDMHAYIEQPVLAPATEALDSRLAYRAGVIIVDGKWYARDPSSAMAAWPPAEADALYSDHPCSTANGIPGGAKCAGAGTAGQYAGPGTPVHHRLYSIYERKASGLYNPDAGVVSYGRLPADASGAPTNLTPAVKVAYAMTPFVDETFPVMPININMATLANALASVVPAHDEVGHSAVATLAPRSYIVYITSRTGASPTSANALPYALCGETPGETSIDAGTGAGTVAQAACDAVTQVRYNAVRLWNAFSARELGDDEITIVTDLPLYIQGDYDPANRNLIAARRVTVLPRDFNEGTGIGTNTSIRVRSSILTGWPASGSHEIEHLIRPGAAGLDLDLDGSILGVFPAPSPALPHGIDWNDFDWHWDNDLNDPFRAAAGTPRVSTNPPLVMPVFTGCGA